VFVDRVTLLVRAGTGGAGSAHMASEPFKPRAGADGGDGGPGGDVVIAVDSALFDLARYRDRPRHAAEKGGPGGRNRRTGAAGADLVLSVPDGTLVSDERGVIADLVGAGASVVAARGGRGGHGSASLSSGRNRVPRAAEPGEEGEERRIELELRLVADAGLVGLPNAGKSTLLAALTAARPKIADYPFTTLSPNLGVAGSEHRMIVADVPGLIHGAHQGKGLGLDFLRHVSRCRVLVYVVDLTSEDPRADLAAVRAEVAAYDAALAERPHLVVGSKADLEHAPPPPEVDLVVSGVSGDGLDELGARLEDVVSSAIAAEPERTTVVVVRPGRDPFTVRREGVGFRVSGRRIERWVAETDMQDPREVAGLQRRLVKAGVERRLAAEGARRGDEVSIGAMTFEFIPDEDLEPDERGSVDDQA
jgi:GTP-binding protein